MFAPRRAHLRFRLRLFPAADCASCTTMPSKWQLRELPLLLPVRATVAGIANAGPRAGAPARRSRGARRLGGETPAFAFSRSRAHPRGHPRRAVPPAFATSGQWGRCSLRSHRPGLFFPSGPSGSPPRAEAWRRALRSASPCGRRAGRCGPSGAALFGRRLCPARIASARHPASLRRPGCSPPAHARSGFAVRSESGLWAGSGRRARLLAGRGSVNDRTKRPRIREQRIPGARSRAGAKAGNGDAPTRAAARSVDFRRAFC
jgi:hypothetical protein